MNFVPPSAPSVQMKCPGFPDGQSWKGTEWGPGDSVSFGSMDCFHLTSTNARIPLSSMAIEAEDSSSTALGFRFPGSCAKRQGHVFIMVVLGTSYPILVTNHLEPQHAVAFFTRSPPSFLRRQATKKPSSLSSWCLEYHSACQKSLPLDTTGRWEWPTQTDFDLSCSLWFVSRSMYMYKAHKWLCIWDIPHMYIPHCGQKYVYIYIYT